MARRTFIRLQLRKSSCDPLKQKKFESISSNSSRDIAKSLKISFGSSFVSLRAFRSKLAVSIPSIHLSKKNKPHSIISIRSWVLVYITFAHGRTDIFWKSFIFFSWLRIYIHVYTYLGYFSNFTPILIKVSIPFFLWKWVWLSSAVHKVRYPP